MRLRRCVGCENNSPNSARLAIGHTYDAQASNPLTHKWLASIDALAATLAAHLLRRFRTRRAASYRKQVVAM